MCNVSTFISSFQGVIIMVCFTLSCSMINNSIQDWNRNPVLITVDNIETSLSEVDFPALTVCNEPQYQPDNWALPEMVLNAFAFVCNPKYSPEDCQKTEALRKDFKPVLNAIFDELSQLVTKSKFHYESLEKYFLQSKVDAVIQSILANLTTIQKLEDTMKSSIGKFGTYHQFIYNFVPESKENVECKKDCLKLKNKVLILLFKAQVLGFNSRMGFGTYLRQNAKLLGITFDSEDVIKNSNLNINLCKKISIVEHLYHGLMTKVGQSLGMNISIHDIPNLFQVEPPRLEEDHPRKDYPFYTLCSYSHLPEFVYTDVNGNQYLPSCIRQWDEIIETSNKSEHNPYVRIPNLFCSGGTTNITGSNLHAIMLVMKFAYHVASHEDFKNTYKLIKGLNLPYEMIDLAEDSKFKYKQQRPYIFDFSGLPNVHLDKGLSFEPVISNVGMCFSCNSLGVDTIFKTSEFEETFKNNFWNKTIMDGIKKASERSVKIFLDKHQFYLPDRSRKHKSFL